MTTKLICMSCRNIDHQSATMCSKCGTPYPAGEAPESTSQIRKDQVIANRYVILDMIGSGGMGAIYKVQDNTLDEIVALKTLLPQYTKDKIVVERFFNEARIARGLSHPNIVRVHDIGTSDGLVYISMELLHGRTLRSMLDKVNPGRRIPLNAILRMFDALCAALDYAHEFTVHRDIKPENVMLLPDGTVKLMDFGISKLMSNPNLTSASMVMGTPQYMSPEQLKNSANVDRRTDIYSVGIMLYEALSGDLPTGIRNPDTLLEIPKSLDPVIAKCCQRDPRKRYQSAGELREHLRKIRIQVETQSEVTQDDAVQPHSADAASTSSGRSLRKLIAACLIAVVLVAAYPALNYAEQERKNRIVNAPLVTIAPELPDDQPDAAEVAPDTFLEMKTLVLRSRILAEVAPNNMQNRPDRDYAEILFEQADDRWELVKDTTDSADGLATSWYVLHRYLAVIHWPEGMTFIPEQSGAAGVQGSAFFVDQNAVTGFHFAGFSRNSEWRMPPGASSTSTPVTNVTYYDALAYLASQSAPRQLPTVSQWNRAVHATVEISGDEAASAPLVPLVIPMVYEWTRATGSSMEPAFKAPMPVMIWERDSAGNLSTRPETLAYGKYLREVGFRGVIELPSMLKDAQAWLDR